MSDDGSDEKKPKKIPVKVEKKQKIMDLSQNVDKLKPPKKLYKYGRLK